MEARGVMDPDPLKSVADPHPGFLIEVYFMNQISSVSDFRFSSSCKLAEILALVGPISLGKFGCQCL
jgi:hypothetical protein